MLCLLSSLGLLGVEVIIYNFLNNLELIRVIQLAASIHINPHNYWRWRKWNISHSFYIRLGALRKLFLITVTLTVTLLQLAGSNQGLVSLGSN